MNNMAKTTSSFDHLWTSELEAKAKSLGVIDGDLPRIRATVKNTLISADWAANDGTVTFSSEEDRNNAIKAAVDVLTIASQRTAAERRVVVKPTVGSAPTKSQVLLASAGGDALTAFSSVSTVRTGAFAPEMAKAGDKCPRCNSSMEPIGLVNDRAALYCSRDRVVLPLSASSSVRY
jgi:hypothetical protein